MRLRNSRETDTLGAWVHGALTALHALGAFYNVRRKNWWDAALHGAWLVYDADATRRHMKNRKIDGSD